jgi:preprotein translocase subunit SecD
LAQEQPFRSIERAGSFSVRIKTWYTLVLILIITLVSGWISLPTDVLNFNGAKDEFYVREGLDLQGGLQVVLEARPPEGQDIDSGTLEGTRNTLERRVNGLGVSEPVIQTRGDNQILVELPGVDDPEAAVEVLKATALLEIIDTGGAAPALGSYVNTTLGPATDGVTAESEIQPDTSGPTYTTIVSGADLSDAFRSSNSLGSVVVAFEMNSSGADKLFDFTSANIGQPMAVVVDKQVINVATIQDAIGRSGQITGLNIQQADDLALQLKSGALATPLEVVQSRTVGPTLGQDSIDKSITAGLVGLGLVAIMMILYYRIPGLLSVLALVVYTSIVFALFKVIPVTLTLAGIAGFILSIGMAVDANVLIFARLKEELRRGRSVRVAVEAGFDHAWPSIRDSNISTMITCAILYWFGQYVGASIIQGFALTLFIGVAVSMFTAVVVTRNFMRMLLDRSWFTNHWWLGVENTQPELGIAD